MANLGERLSQGFSYLLILAATVMLGWGLLGFLEYFTGLAPLMPLQNATFPAGTQFIHWLLITLSGGRFPDRICPALELHALGHDRVICGTGHAMRHRDIRFHGKPEPLCGLRAGMRLLRSHFHLPAAIETDA